MEIQIVKDERGRPSDLAISNIQEGEAEHANLIEGVRSLIVGTYRQHGHESDLVVVVSDLRSDVGRQAAQALKLPTQNADGSIAVGASSVSLATRVVRLSAREQATLEQTPVKGFRLLLVTSGEERVYLS